MPSRGQAITLSYYAYNTVASGPKTGDVANHTIRIRKDGGASAAPTNAPTECDATNMPGWYQVVLTDAECTADVVVLGGKSSTSGVVITGAQVTFESATWNTTTPPTAAATASAVRTELTTELGRVDAAVSTRMATFAYTDPDNATIALIAGYLDTEVAVILSGTTTLLSRITGAVLLASGYTAPPSAASVASAVAAHDVGNGRTIAYFLQGGSNKISFAADGLSYTVYATDDTTPLYTGTSTRLATTVGGLRSVDPS